MGGLFAPSGLGNVTDFLPTVQTSVYTRKHHPGTLIEPRPPRVLLHNSGSLGWGGGANPPPPSDPDFIVGKDEIVQKEILIWLFLVHKLLDFWVPDPPPPLCLCLPLSPTGGAPVTRALRGPWKGVRGEGPQHV